MYQYLIKEGNMVKFFPRELYPLAVTLLGSEPTIKVLGDNIHFDKSDKADCLLYHSYIGVLPLSKENQIDIQALNVTDARY